jgi:hypothetical protein
MDGEEYHLLYKMIQRYIRLGLMLYIRLHIRL